MTHNPSRYCTGTQPSRQVHKANSAISPLAAPLHTSQITGTPQFQGPSLNVVHASVQKEQDVHEIDWWITSSLWLEANAHEPLVGSQGSSPLVDQYGVRGLSCYSSLVEIREDGSFACRQARCMQFSARSMEAGITHQRTYHYDHRPYKCSDFTGLHW